MAKNRFVWKRGDVTITDGEGKEIDVHTSAEERVQKEDIKKWAGGIVKVAKDTVTEIVENIKEKSDDFGKRQFDARFEKDKLLLRPVFKEMLLSPANVSSTRGASFAMPAIIHVVDKDKKHADSKACEHSLGHLSEENGITVLNVYPHHMKDLGVSFFPNAERSIYYVDPVQKDLYIDIQEYFQQLKLARVNELEQLAYALGATHFEILFKTNTVELEKAKKKAELGVKKGKKKLVDVKAEHDEKEMKKESIEVAKALDLGGHSDPQVPEMVYFKDNADIQNLIYMRMDKKNDLKKKECSIKYSFSSGITESDAAKIQGAVDKMGGGSAGVSLMNESLNESHTTLIYKIEF